MAVINQQTVQVSLPQNQQVPNEGPKAIPLLLNFVTVASYSLDLTYIQESGQISMVQTLFIDASTATAALVVTVNGTNQKIVAAAGTQGYYPVLCPNPPKFTFANTSGADVIPVFLINAPISGVVWSTT
jgi:hypothetical protein